MSYELSNASDLAVVKSALGVGYQTLATEFYDDFNRSDTATGSLGSPPVGGGAYELRGTGAVAASVGRITNKRFVSNAGEIIYATQTLKGNANRMGAVISFTAGNGGSDNAVATFLISPSKTGLALVTNCGIHIQVTRNSVVVQYLLANSDYTVESKSFPSQLALDTPYICDFEIDGTVIRYSVAGIQGVVVNKDLPTAGLGKYVTWEHYYPSSSVAELVRFESIWAGSSLVGRATMSELCVAAYKFSTAGWLDASGRGNTLTGNGAPTVASGLIGNGVSLTAASSQYLSLASNNDLRLNGKDWSISCWVKPNAITGSGFRPIFDKSGGSSLEYSLRMDLGVGQCWVAASPDGTTGSAAATGSSTNLTAGAWNHLFVFYDSISQSIGISANGGSINQTALASVANGTDTFKIGSATWLGNPYFDGMIDEFYMFVSPPGHGGVLNPTRRALLYNGGEGISWPLAA